MSKAGPFTRSRSQRAKQVEPDLSNPTFESSHSRAASWQASLDHVQGSSRREDIGRRLHSDEIVIGLALGSPSQNPLPPLPSDDRDVDNPLLESSGPRSLLHPVSESGSVVPEIKRKGSKWKSLGGLFGRKHFGPQSSEPAPFYQLDQARQHGLAKPNTNKDHVQTNVLRRKRADTVQSIQDTGESSSMFQKTSKSEVGGLLRRNSSRKKGSRRKQVGDLKAEMQDLHNALSQHMTAEAWVPPRGRLRPPGGSLLQVEIPNVELERYSVMFGEVLGSSPQTNPTPPSLLLRRQAHLGELQTFVIPTESIQSTYVSQPESWLTDAQHSRNEDLPKPHQRAASVSSKSSTKSASFSLFPPSPKGCAPSKLLPRPSPLSRSTTAPGIKLPPPRPTIHKGKSQAPDGVLVVVPPPDLSPSTPTSNGRMPSFGPPAPSANSTQASFFECEEYPGYTFERDPSNSSTKTTKGTFANGVFPVRKDSRKKLLSKDSEAHSHQRAQESVSTAAAAAEVSIARQISISRRQRQMLVPIAQARQPRRPTLVSSQSTSALRKSHHPTLSDA